jgi:hypothetical protein
MNDNLQQNLLRARADLLQARDDLAHVRKANPQPWFIAGYEKRFCAALDRVHEAGCMANGVFR